MVSAFNPYNTLPVADEALERGGMELLRAGLADEELFVTLRSPFPKPDQWGEVLAEITVNLASLYSADGDFTENEVIAAVAAGFRDALRNHLESSTSVDKGIVRAKPGKSTPAKSAQPPGKAPAKKTPAKKAKVLAKSKATAKTPLKARAKSPVKSPAGKQPGKRPLAKKSPAKSKSASKAVAGRKGARG